MARHTIERLTVTIDGVDHVFEGTGTLTLVTTKSGDGKSPVARAEAVMPLAAEFTTGEGGKYVKIASAL